MTSHDPLSSWPTGTKVLVGVVVIGLIAVGDIGWWFDVPTVAIALVLAGVWLLVAERDRPGGGFLDRPATSATDSENHPGHQRVECRPTTLHLRSGRRKVAMRAASVMLRTSTSRVRSVTKRATTTQRRRSSAPRATTAR